MALRSKVAVMDDHVAVDEGLQLRRDFTKDRLPDYVGSVDAVDADVLSAEEVSRIDQLVELVDDHASVEAGRSDRADRGVAGVCCFDIQGYEALHNAERIGDAWAGGRPLLRHCRAPSRQSRGVGEDGADNGEIPAASAGMTDKGRGVPP